MFCCLKIKIRKI